jgi:hypothetical protein
MLEIKEILTVGKAKSTIKKNISVSNKKMYIFYVIP